MVDKTLAGSGTLGSFDPVQLFAGEQDVVTDRAAVAQGLLFDQFEVIALNGNNIIKYDQAGAAPANKAAGIMLHAINTSNTGLNKATMAPYYTGGFFNHAALVWPAATDTLAERKTAFQGTNISIGTVL